MYFGYFTLYFIDLYSWKGCSIYIHKGCSIYIHKTGVLLFIFIKRVFSYLYSYKGCSSIYSIYFNTLNIKILITLYTAHWELATQKKLTYLGFQYLDHPPYSPDLAPSDYHMFPGLKKSNWKVAIFRPMRRLFLPLRPGWADNLLNFVVVEWLAKVRATGWEVYWASWGVCWINPEFGRCSLFPSWSG